MATCSSVGDSSFLQLLRENYLECTLCRETYKKPKYLSCHHTFCQGCLVDFRKHNPGDIVCPTCREVTKVPSDGIPGLRNNFLIRSLTDDVSLFSDRQVKCDNCSEDKMATMVCVDCATYFCAGCFKGHQSVKSIRDSHNTFQVEMLQNVVNLQKFQKNRFATCPTHNEPMKIYCKVEKIQLCHTCSFASSHQDHKMCPIQEQLEELLAEITSTLEKSQISDSAIAAENKKLEEAKIELLKATTKSLADLEKEESETIQKVKEKYNGMRNELNAMSEKNINICNTKIARNNVLMKSFEGKIAEKEVLKMIPISCCIDAAEGFLNSITEADKSNMQKLDAEKEGTINYFEANDHDVILNSGCVKSKYISTVKLQRAEVITYHDFCRPIKFVDLTRPHYSAGRNVQVGDRVLRYNANAAEKRQPGTVTEIKQDCVLVNWNGRIRSHRMTDIGRGNDLRLCSQK